MSQSEIDRFVADLKSNRDLRGEAAKLQPDKAQGVPLATLVSFAAGKGYGFTAEEVAERVRTGKAQADDKRLSDSELNGIVGGNGGEQGPGSNWDAGELLVAWPSSGSADASRAAQDARRAALEASLESPLPEPRSFTIEIPSGISISNMMRTWRPVVDLEPPPDE
jgi:hypothetical protein